MTDKLRRTVTADLIIGMNPCNNWTEEQIREAIPEEIGLKDILLDERIPILDRIWGALHTKFLPEKVLRHYALYNAERIHGFSNKPSPEVVEFIAVARRYIDGEATKKELDTANRVAYKAAYSAAYRVANRVAYRAAYRAANSAACWEAELDWQINRILELLIEQWAKEDES